MACGIHQDVQPPSEPSSEEDAPYFDAVWRAEATQAQVFDTLGLPLLERLLAGVNVCVSVYGHDAHDDGATQGQLTIWCCSVSPPG